jgi:hypothetical protein
MDVKSHFGAWAPCLGGWAGQRIIGININTLEGVDATQLDANAIGVVEPALLDRLPRPYKTSRVMVSACPRRRVAQDILAPC